MRVIIPTTPTLVSSTVPEPYTGEVAYNAGTTYALGAHVYSPTYHKIYESLQTGNVGHPLPVPPATQDDWWIDVGATNRYACIDLARNTQSVGASPMVITIAPGQRVNSLAVMGMEADGVTVTMTNGGSTVYTATRDLRLRRVRDGYEYCFKPFDQQQSAVMFDLPPYYSATITVRLTRATGSVKVGSILPGNYVYMGITKAKAVSDSRNFSTIERDIYGTATLVPRRTIPQLKATVIGDPVITNDLLDARERLNAVVAVYSGLDDQGSSNMFEAVLILGVYTRFSINLENAAQVETTLEVEEI